MFGGKTVPPSPMPGSFPSTSTEAPVQPSPLPVSQQANGVKKQGPIVARQVVKGMFANAQAQASKPPTPPQDEHAVAKGSLSSAEDKLDLSNRANGSTSAPLLVPAAPSASEKSASPAVDSTLSETGPTPAPTTKDVTPPLKQPVEVVVELESPSQSKTLGRQDGDCQEAGKVLKSPMSSGPRP